MVITSTGNAKVKRIIALKRKRRAREEEGVFLVEGLRMFKEIPMSGLQEVYVSASLYGKEKAMVDKVLADTKVRAEILSDSVFAYVSDTKTPQGILCIARQLRHSLKDMLAGTEPFVIVLDRLQDPGNLGTILRAAEGAGVTGVVMDRECVDMYNPKTIRSTMGSVFRVPFVYVDNLRAAIDQIKEAGIHTYAACLEGSRDYAAADYTGPVAFFIGNEGSGLRRETAESADTLIKIPMQGQVESLNAAVASSVLLFEAARQRRMR